MNDEGDYRFVMHSKDAHRGKYRDHLNHRALDLNSKAVVYFADNFGFSLTSSAIGRAKFCQEHPSSGRGYKAFTYISPEPLVALSRAASKSSIVWMQNHGSAGGMQIGETAMHAWYASHSPDPINKPQVDQAGRFKKVKFMAFVGCYTANDDPYFGNIMTAVVDQGVNSTMGFTDLLEGGGNIPYQYAYWFWQAANGWSGEDGTKPLNIIQSANYAVRQLRDIHGQAYGYENVRFRNASGVYLFPLK